MDWPRYVSLEVPPLTLHPTGRGQDRSSITLLSLESFFDAASAQTLVSLGYLQVAAVGVTACDYTGFFEVWGEQTLVKSAANVHINLFGVVAAKGLPNWGAGWQLLRKAGHVFVEASLKLQLNTHLLLERGNPFHLLVAPH